MSRARKDNQLKIKLKQIYKAGRALNIFILYLSVNNCRGSRVAGRKSRVAGRKSWVAGKKSRVNFNYLIIIFNRNKSSKKASGADCVYC